MAIRVQPFFSVVLRPFVPQAIASSGWTMLVHHAASGLFDGEIMVFVAMSMIDIRSTMVSLERSGFKGPSNESGADYALFDMGDGVMPSWLEKVAVTHFGDSRTGDAAWKLVNSQVYTLHDRVNRADLSTKGYDVDWPPYIGRINA